MTESQITRFSELVNSIPIPSKKINVFGGIQCYIHVTCESLETAEKWALALGKFCRTVRIMEAYDTAKENKNTVLRPSVIKVYKIGGIV
jgi:hypothetical protein